MYYVENINPLITLELNDNILSICDYIGSKLRDLKNYIVNLFRKDTNKYFEEYFHNFEQLEDILDEHEEFSNEDLALLRADNIIEYIFEHKKLTQELAEFMCKVWDTFSSLLKFKLYSLDENNNVSQQKYDDKYSQFEKEMKKYETHFYLNIYQNTHEHDDFIIQLGNIILG